MNKRMWLTGFATILGVGAAAWAQEKKEAVVRETKVRTTQDQELPNYTIGSRDAAADLLRQRVASVDWKDATFEEVLDWVKDQGEGRVNIIPKWGPLGLESVNRETTINLQLNTTTISDVLNEVINQLSEDGQIQYRGISNKLTISTKQDFERTMYVRVYDLSDMLFRVENFGQEAPLIDLKKNASSKGGGSGQSVFQGTGGSGGTSGKQTTEQMDKLNEERLQDLRELIEQTISPESWNLAGSESPGGGQPPGGGGGQGRIRIYNTSLIIRNTIEVHEMIAGTFSFGE